jgi:hypothetical protein
VYGPEGTLWGQGLRTESIHKRPANLLISQNQSQKKTSQENIWLLVFFQL